MLTDRSMPAPRLTHRWLRTVLGLTLCSALSACGAGYLTQAARGQWQVLRARRPIERLLADPAIDPHLKARLQLVSEARRFASAELGLPDNRSYRSYSDLGRPYAVWNVVAAPEFSVVPLRWCFPIAGCTSYRGYFRESQARAFGARLSAHGNDVLVAGVTAYSTLGHFDDPVLNTMLRYDDLDLVSTLFHELAHQRLYVPGDSDFSEAFATTVADEGLRRWLAAHGREGELEQYRQQGRVLQQVVAAFAAGRAQLAALYRQPLEPTAMRAAKQALMGDTGQRVRAIEAQHGLRTGYDAWIDAGLNNAHLASIATYYDCIPGLQRLLADSGGELPRFYVAARRLRHDAPARRALCRSTPLNDPRDGSATGPAAPATAAPGP